MSARIRFLAAVTFLVAPIANAAAPAQTLDDFSDPSLWTASGSDQVSATLHTDGAAL